MINIFSVFIKFLFQNQLQVIDGFQVKGFIKEIIKQLIQGLAKGTKPGCQR
jgi:hypothetical protein